MFPSPPGTPTPGRSLGGDKFFGFVISKWHIWVNSEVLNLKFFFIGSFFQVLCSSVGFGSSMWQILDFRAKE